MPRIVLTSVAVATASVALVGARSYALAHRACDAWPYHEAATRDLSWAVRDGWSCVFRYGGRVTDRDHIGHALIREPRHPRSRFFTYSELVARGLPIPGMHPTLPVCDGRTRPSLEGCQIDKRGGTFEFRSLESLRVRRDP